MSEKLNAIRNRMKEESIDILFFTSADEFQNECPPLREERIRWLTGFTDAMGFAVITANQALLFLSPIGISVAEHEVDQTIWTLQDTTETSLGTWVSENLQTGQTLALEGARFSVNELQHWTAIAKRRDAQLRLLEDDIADAIWTDRPLVSAAPALVHPLPYAGREHQDKIAELSDYLQNHSLDGYLVTDPGHVCWLLNLRGRDITGVHQFNPVLLCRAFVTVQGSVILFVDPDKITDTVGLHLGDQVAIYAPDKLIPTLNDHTAATIGLDANHCPSVIGTALKDAGKTITSLPCPIDLSRGIKNPVEIDGSRAAHRRDAIAVMETLCWLDRHIAPTTLTERDVALYLRQCRENQDLFVDDSFTTIAGTGPHGAIIHYHISDESNATLLDNNLLLIDSGGQYPDGTTDITRTVVIGTGSADMIRDYTAVMQSHIAVSATRFPHNTAGAEFEGLARRPLWDNGINFRHRIGHGIGSFGAVHEGPQVFAKQKPEAMPEHMFVTIEPGYYKADHYGIRLENVVVVVDDTKDKDEQKMLRFDPLTLVPFDSRLIDFTILATAEKTWLRDYHQLVLDQMLPLLSAELQGWLKDKCKSFLSSS